MGITSLDWREILCFSLFLSLMVMGGRGFKGNETVDAYEPGMGDGGSFPSIIQHDTTILHDDGVLLFGRDSGFLFCHGRWDLGNGFSSVIGRFKRKRDYPKIGKKDCVRYFALSFWRGEDDEEVKAS